MGTHDRSLVFISYSHADATWLERLLTILKPYVAEGDLSVWCDNDIETGAKWESDLHSALQRAAVGVLLVTPQFLASDFITRTELPALVEAAEQHALKLILVPVSASGYRATPLGQYQWVRDPSEPLDALDEAGRNRVLVQIAEEIAAKAGWQRNQAGDVRMVGRGDRPEEPGPRAAVATPVLGRMHDVPRLPPQYLPRPDDVARLKDALLRGAAAVGITGEVPRMGLHGQGGIGKSILAIALVADNDVRAAFPGGIYWVSVGQNPDLLRLQSVLVESLGGDVTRVTSVQEGCRALAARLAERPCLVVADDVWRVEHARAFDVADPPSQLLLTTRDASILTALGAHQETIARLPENVALELLGKWARVPAADLPVEAREVADECGYLPLALAVVGARVRDGADWADLLEALRRGRVEFLDHGDSSVFRSLRLGVDALPPSQRDRYVELAVFPEDVTVPQTLVERLWKATAALDSLDSRTLLATLATKALLEREQLPDGKRVFAMHDLQHDFVRLLAEDLPRLHHTMVDAVWSGAPLRGDPGAPWFHLPSGEPYPWLHLAEHLVMAGRRAELRALLLDYRWMEAKLTKAGLHALLSDYSPLAADSDVALVGAALRMSAHVLARDAGQLPSQLLGRLLAVDRPAIREMLASVQPSDARPWLRPRTAALTPPATPLLRTLEGHAHEVWAVAALSDRIVSGAYDGTLKEWDLETGEVTAEFDAGGEWIETVAVTPDGRRALLGARSLRVWEFDSGASRVLHGDTGTVWSVSIAADGRRAVSASADGTVRVWDLDTETQVRVLVGHGGEVHAVAFTPDGARIVSGSADETVRIWNVEGDEPPRVLGDGNKGVWSVAVDPGGTLVAAGCYDRSVRVWDLDTGEEVAVLRGHGGVVGAVAFLSDGTLLSGSHDWMVRLWDVRRQETLRTFEGHAYRVVALAPVPGRRWFVSASADRTLKLWDPGAPASQHAPAAAWGTSVALTADGRAVWGAHDNLLRVQELASGRVVRTLGGHGRVIWAVAVTRDGCRAVSGSADHTLRIWNPGTGEHERTLSGHRDEVWAVALTPNGTTAVSGSADGTLRVWDLAAGTMRHELGAFEGGVGAVAITPDGRYAVAGSNDNLLTVWEIESGTLVRTFHGHTGQVVSVAVAPDGYTVASGAHDSLVRTWDLATGELVCEFRGHGDDVWAVAFTPDGRRIVSSSRDRTLRVWNAGSGEALAVFHADSPVTSVAVAPDGRTVVISSVHAGVHALTLEEGASGASADPAR